MKMKDHYQLGRKFIVDEAETELEAGVSEPPRLPLNDGLFEIALRRLGEDALADRFINTNLSVEDIVRRVSSYDYILTVIIANVERNNKEFAQQIERKQRELFYLEGAGYWDPHFKLPYMMAKREQVRQQIIERESVQLGIHEKVRDAGGNWVNNGRTYIPRWVPDGSAIGNVSLYEAILAISSNIVLEDYEHARKVLNDVFSLYFDGTKFLWIGANSPGELECTASLCKLADLLGDSRGREVYEKRKLEFESPPFGQKLLPHMSLYLTMGGSALVFALDHFGNKAGALSLREKIAGRFAENKIPNLKDGLALTGLEAGKPNYFYTG